MADYQYIQATGVIIPDTADTLAGVQGEWRAAFGEDLLVSTDTPQGVLIAAETEARDAVARNNAKLANQINPDLAGGVFLDALWALTFGARTQATRTIVPGVVLTGVPGTIIASGVQLQLGDNTFSSVGEVTLATDGTARVAFQADTPGPIPAPIGSLTQIVTGVLGWETANNPLPATVGVEEESDTAARARRRRTLGRNGLSLVGAIVGTLYSVPDVKSLQFRENKTNAPLTIGGVTLKPHSVYAVVYGGTDQAVAEALLETTTLGAGFNGATTVQVLEPASGQNYPVSFDRPQLVPIFVRYTVKADTSLIDPQVVVRQATLDYAAGRIDGEDGFGVGLPVSPFELSGAVNSQAPGIYVRKVELSLDGQTWSTSELPMTLKQMPTVTAGAISVVYA